MSEPVTEAELAEALRCLLSASKREVIAVDDAQCLVHEHDTKWPDGYDFQALEDAHEEEIAARQSLRERHTATESLLARYDAQQAAKAQECTGVAAVWCPRCGDCTCSDREEFASTPDDKCPLHGLTSTHADEQHPEPSKPALSEVEKAAAKAIEAYNASNGEGGEECDYAMFSLREALRKRGAL